MAGNSRFSLWSAGTFVYFGDVIDSSASFGTLTVLDGADCTASAESLGCGTHGDLRLSLSAGREVLIVASRTLDTDSSDGVYDLTAPYQIVISSCTPACAAKECGDDGCGGSCGTCTFGETCSGGLCQCAPNCGWRSCGSDGCGGSCGTCWSGSTCSSSGACVSTCTPSCGGRVCGSDGCGGSCGSCSLGTSCSGGVCTGDSDSCDPVADAGCATPNECLLLANEKTRCALMGNGQQGSSCSSTTDCDGGHGCFAEHCRAICELGGANCPFGYSCNGVAGWTQYGACAENQN